MQDFFDNAQPRVVAMMLIGVVLLVAVVEITYLLWLALRSRQVLSCGHSR